MNKSNKYIGFRVDNYNNLYNEFYICHAFYNKRSEIDINFNNVIVFNNLVDYYEKSMFCMYNNKKAKFFVLDDLEKIPIEFFELNINKDISFHEYLTRIEYIRNSTIDNVLNTFQNKTNPDYEFQKYELSYDAIVQKSIEIRKLLEICDHDSCLLNAIDEYIKIENLLNKQKSNSTLNKTEIEWKIKNL